MTSRFAGAQGRITTCLTLSPASHAPTLLRRTSATLSLMIRHPLTRLPTQDLEDPFLTVFCLITSHRQVSKETIQSGPCQLCLPTQLTSQQNGFSSHRRQLRMATVGPRTSCPSRLVPLSIPTPRHVDPHGRRNPRSDSNPLALTLQPANSMTTAVRPQPRRLPWSTQG